MGGNKLVQAGDKKKFGEGISVKKRLKFNFKSHPFQFVFFTFYL